MASLQTSWTRRWRLFTTLAILLLSACTAAPTPEPEPQHLPKRGFTLILPIYDDPGLTYALTTLKPHLRDEDRFMIVSGNGSGAVDTAWINRAALELRTAYPHIRLYAATSGLENIKLAAQGVDDLIEAIVYIYEPNFPNQPEFSWDFTETLARFAEASAVARQYGFRAVGKPTGRPLLQPNLTVHAWDYGVLAGSVDELLIQTQTYCKDGATAFAQAIDAISGQYRAHGQTLPWLPQVTVASSAPNGTSVAQAQACIAEARTRGVGGTVLWWSPQSVERTLSVMEDLNRVP